MKRLLFVSVFILGGLFLHAQNFRINGYAGYVFDDHVSSYATSTNYFEGEVKGSFQWGVDLEYIIHETTGIQLTYLRQDTKAPLIWWDNGQKTKEFDLAVNWIMAGGAQYFQLNNPKIEPYLGGQLGMAIIELKNPNTGNEGNATKFAWGIRGGTNFWLSEKMGIKIQAILLSAVQGVGGTIYFGSGGAGAGVSSYSSMLQFGLGGGLAFKLGKK